MDKEEEPLIKFQRIKRASDRSKRHFRTDKENSCGNKKQLSHAAAKRCASRHVGRAYKCQYCRAWHFSATDMYKDGT